MIHSGALVVLGVAAALGVSADAPVAVAPDAPIAHGCALEGARIHARLRGALDEEIDWSGTVLGCDGMPRADGGVRLRFEGPADGGPLVLVFGLPSLAPGQSAKAVPVNVTLIPGSGTLYGTRGADRCVLDVVSQAPLPGATDTRRWRIDARGFCLEPARAIGGTGAVLLTTFEFTGLLVATPDEAEAS